MFPQRLHSRGRILKDALLFWLIIFFYLKICLFLRSGSAYEWRWSKVHKKHTFPDIRFKRRAWTGWWCKESRIFWDNKPFQQLKLVQILWARQCLKIKGIRDTSMSWWLISLLHGFPRAKLSWFNMLFCIINSWKPVWATYEKSAQPVNLQNDLLVIFETMQTY